MAASPPLRVDRQYPQATRPPWSIALMSHWSPGAHGPSVPGWLTGRQFRVAHGPSAPVRLTGRQYPGGARAVSARVAHGPSDPGGARAVSSRVAHGPSVPGWRTGRQLSCGSRAVSTPGPRWCTGRQSSCSTAHGAATSLSKRTERHLRTVSRAGPALGAPARPTRRGFG